MTKPQYNVARASLVIFSSSLFFLYVFMQLNIFNALNPALIAKFNLSSAQLGELSSYYFYGIVLFLFPAGILLDRYSARFLITLGMFVVVLSTLVFALSDSLIVLKIARFFTGLAGAFCMLGNIRLASRWFPPQRMALVIGLVVTMGMAGGTLAQTPMTLLIDHYGMKMALLIDAAVGFILWLWILAFVRNQPKNDSENFALSFHPHHVSLLPALKKALISRQNWFAGLYTSLMNLPIFIFGAMWGSLYLTEVFNYTRAQASLVTSMVFIGTVVGSPLIGGLSDRIGRRKRPMVWCAVISLVIMLWIMYANYMPFYLGIILFFALGLITSAQIITYPLVAESNPPEIIGTAQGIASTLIMAGGFTQILFGWLLSLHWSHEMHGDIPWYSVANFNLALLILPVAFVLSILLSLFLKETYCQRDIS